MSKKAELLGALAGKNRGLLANELEKVALLASIAQLEDLNPTPQPLARPDLLAGNWRLLYTTSKDLLGFDRLPLLQPGQIYQCIHSNNARIYNIAEIVGVPFLESLVTVVATYSPLSERRVNVKFQRSIVGLQRLVSYRNPQEFVRQLETGKHFPPFDFPIEDRDRQGWLEITYLDEDLRIGRGNNGSLFVLTKEKEKR
ncbi:PAP/fibrillin family protein [Rubidibacter lacunae]|uniref:PAP/fibrillin family protein n=1 Tax=Rubidibacter lacunae TaxID=582514 RepID=UPI000590A8F9|nr:PAP/fibrillin family protein [Rubidibacter lacunae]